MLNCGKIVPYMIEDVPLVGIGCKEHQLLFVFAFPGKREIALKAIKNDQCRFCGDRGMLIECVGIADFSAVAQHGHENLHAAR